MAFGHCTASIELRGCGIAVFVGVRLIVYIAWIDHCFMPVQTVLNKQTLLKCKYNGRAGTALTKRLYIVQDVG